MKEMDPSSPPGPIPLRRGNRSGTESWPRSLRKSFRGMLDGLSPVGGQLQTSGDDERINSTEKKGKRRKGRAVRKMRLGFVFSQARGGFQETSSCRYSGHRH